MRFLGILLFVFLLGGCASVVRVRRGDTLYSISRRYEVPVRALIQENNISAPFIIKVGQRLRIPTQKTYTVRRGDTLYSIARKYDLSVNQVARQNKITPPYILTPGQTLVLQSWDDSIQGGQTSSGKQVRRAAIQVPKQAKNKRFNTPVQGKIIQKFGVTSNGTYNDGINISAPLDTPVLVADKGTVVYAGNQLKGYGNLVLVRHDGGWFTAYAHSNKLLVKKGAVVQAKQKIATVGKTGGVKTPQLHFEVRYKSKPVDPSLYLK